VPDPRIIILSGVQVQAWLWSLGCGRRRLVAKASSIIMTAAILGSVCKSRRQESGFAAKAAARFPDRSDCKTVYHCCCISGLTALVQVAIGEDRSGSPMVL